MVFQCGSAETFSACALGSPVQCYFDTTVMMVMYSCGSVYRLSETTQTCVHEHSAWELVASTKPEQQGGNHAFLNLKDATEININTASYLNFFLKQPTASAAVTLLLSFRRLGYVPNATLFPPLPPPFPIGLWLKSSTLYRGYDAIWDTVSVKATVSRPSSGQVHYFPQTRMKLSLHQSAISRT